MLKLCFVGWTIPLSDQMLTALPGLSTTSLLGWWLQALLGLGALDFAGIFAFSLSGPYFFTLFDNGEYFLKEKKTNLF